MKICKNAIVIVSLLIVTGCISCKAKSKIPKCINNPTSTYSKFYFDPRSIQVDCTNFIYYSQATALAMARISNITYIDDKKGPHEDSIYTTINRINRRYHLDQSDWLHCKRFISQEHHVHYLFIGNKHFAALAFRGTLTTEDWIQDAKYHIEDDNVTAMGLPTAHLGFRESLFDALDGVHGGKDGIIARLKSFIVDSLKSKTNDLPLFTTGHSYGAALSELIIPKLGADKNLHYCGSYNFATPLTAAFIDTTIYKPFKNRIFEIFNYKDYVGRAGNRGGVRAPRGLIH